MEEALRELEEAVRRPGALSPVDILELAHRCVRSCHECARGVSGAGAAVGTGPASARLMVVGAEPEKDDAGASRSFSAEAEHLLQRALGKAGIGLQDVYFTTAIKHRDSVNTAPATPVEEDVSERDLGAISACRRLLEAEMAAVKPEVVLCLGSTATLSVLGRRMDLSAERGRDVPSRVRTRGGRNSECRHGSRTARGKAARQGARQAGGGVARCSRTSWRFRPFQGSRRTRPTLVRDRSQPERCPRTSSTQPGTPSSTIPLGSTPSGPLRCGARSGRRHRGSS